MKAINYVIKNRRKFLDYINGPVYSYHGDRLSEERLAEMRWNMLYIDADIHPPDCIRRFWLMWKEELCETIVSKDVPLDKNILADSDVLVPICGIYRIVDKEKFLRVNRFYDGISDSSGDSKKMADVMDRMHYVTVEIDGIMERTKISDENDKLVGRIYPAKMIFIVPGVLEKIYGYA